MGYHHTATEIRYNEAEEGEYTVCDGSGEDWSTYYCWYLTTSIDDHLEYFGLYETCSDDDSDQVETWTTAAPSSSGLASLPDAVQWGIYIACALGWILALNFCCCYYKMRKEMQQMYQVANSNAYHAFNDSDM